MQLVGQFGEREGDVVGFGVELVQVVDPELVEIADDDEVRTLRIRQRIRVIERLPERGDRLALPHVGLIQVHSQRLLFDERLRVGDDHVNEAALDGAFLETHVGGDVGHPHDIAQQFQPKTGRIALFVAAARPGPDEIVRCLNAGDVVFFHANSLSQAPDSPAH